LSAGQGGCQGRRDVHALCACAAPRGRRSICPRQLLLIAVIA
jgi:hypothetical protein